MTQQIETWQDFARVTIQTNDLDPMYEVIAKLYKIKDNDWMGRFIMYFLLFYDAGGAYNVANNVKDEQFWDYVEHANELSSTKRGTERRHFRGKNGHNAILKLRSKKSSPWVTLNLMYPAPVFVQLPISYTMLYKHMVEDFSGTQFGPYFIWKLYDIFNVCLGWPVTLDLSEAIRYMPDEPRKAASHFFGSFEEGVTRVTRFVEGFPHPVRKGNCGLAEAETILCMMKGYFWTRTHEIGDDIAEKWHQLYDVPAIRNLLPEAVMPTDYVRAEVLLGAANGHSVGS